MTKVKLVEGQAFQLDPDKRYLIAFDARTISKADLDILTNIIKNDMGVTGVFLTMKGDPKTVTVTEMTPDAAN